MGGKRINQSRAEESVGPSEQMRAWEEISIQPRPIHGA